MAQKGVHLDQETFSCSICLDLLTDPVTIPCGHSYCKNCIQVHWDTEEEKETYSCPQCRQTFTQRPVLVTNTMLAALVEELKKTGLQAAPADLCYAGPEDVACDICTGRKLRAVNSCLVCLVSYCGNHLQPHMELPVYQNHKLVEPSKNLQENICSRHNEVMKMFCRTDQQSICYLCSVDEHKGHDTVSAAAERTERQRELEVSRGNIKQRIQDREKDVKVLQQEVEAIGRSANKTVEDSEKNFIKLIRLMEKRCSEVKKKVRSQQEAEVSRVKELQEELKQEVEAVSRSADKTVEDSEKNFIKLIRLMEKRCSEVKKKVRSQQEAEVSRVKELQEELKQEVEAVSRSADKTVEDSEKNFIKLIRLMEKRCSEVKKKVRSQQKAEESRVKELQEELKQEIAELKRRDAELEKLSRTEDHTHFLHNYSSLPPLSQPAHSSSINIRPLRDFEEVTAAVSQLREKLQEVLTEEWRNISLTDTQVDILLPQQEPKTRADFLKYSRELTLDPNTAFKHLLLSEGNRRATFVREDQFYFLHPDRFTDYCQVLSKEILIGRCYWEVEVKGEGVAIAVVYENISRESCSVKCGFGLKNKSWSLEYDGESYIFWHSEIQTPVSGSWSSRFAVYLDHSAGVLSFYSVSGTMTLLHRVQTTFTQPLYAGLGLYFVGDSVEFCKL